MRFKVLFDFPNITDPNGPEAELINERLTQLTNELGDMLDDDATSVWLDDTTQGVAPPSTF